MRGKKSQIVAALATLALVLFAGSASAARFHPTPTPAASFGPLGGSCPGGALATGMGDLSAAAGTGDLSLLATGTGSRTLLATGKGNLTQSSKTVTGLVTTTGTFTAGESISGIGIPAGTTIEAVGAGILTLSKPANSAATGRELASGSKTVTGLVTTTGTFTAGESISGDSIPAGTTIAAVGAGTLTLSRGVESAGTGGTLISGSKTVTNVATGNGAFAVGMTISNSFQAPIPQSATITAVGAGTLTLSAGVTSARTGAELKFGSTEIASLVTTCGPFIVGQEISALGLSDGTRITAVGPGTLILDRPATAPGSGVALKAGSGFSRIVGADFDQAAEKLYLLERTTDAKDPGKIYGFDVATPGTYTPLPGFPLSTPASFNSPDLAVDNSGGPTQGNIYTSSGADSPGDNQIHGYDPSGVPLPGFPIPDPSGNWRALAVDPSGNVWAASTTGQGGDVAHEYSSAGIPIGTVDLPGNNPVSLEIDANGDLYEVAGGNGGLDLWRIAAPGYDSTVKILPSVSNGFALDRTTHDLYLSFTKPVSGDTHNHVSRHSSDGALLEEFATTAGDENSVPPVVPYSDVAIDEESGAVYVSAASFKSTVDVYEALELPGLANGALSDLSATAATLNGSVNPVGLALSGCEFEYVSEAAYQAGGFTDLSSGGSAPCTPAFSSIPADLDDHPVSAAIAGLSPGVRYRFRISASNLNGANTSRGTAFELTQPGVETVGSPLRSATTARLDSRLDPHGIATDYRFEYIDNAAYQANLAASEPPFAGAASSAVQSVPAGGEIVRASAKLEGLAPATNYHYRIVADNSAFGAVTGGERTVTTRVSNAPLSHGHFPGPPGSDRAWEQVNLPDTSGNPVTAAAGFSADGERAIYQVSGGTGVSEAGTLNNFLFARRPAGAHPQLGWQTEAIFPPRKDTAFSAWRPLTGDDELSTLLGLNIDFVDNSAAAVWRLPTGSGAPAKLYDVPTAAYGGTYLFSDDGSRALLVLNGSFDPAHPSPKDVPQLYDVSSGAPELVSFLPDETVPPCGTPVAQNLFVLPDNWATRSTHWIAADGSRTLFIASPSCDSPHLYMRDFVAGETLLIDGPPLDGPDCSGAIIRSTAEAVYFWTQSKLDAADTAIGGSCADGPDEFTPGGDVYRYDLAGSNLACLTCIVPGGFAANISVGSFIEGGRTSIALAADGSRLYFTTRTHLLPGAPEAGTLVIYRVNISTGNLAYVGPVAAGDRVGDDPVGGTMLTRDGRFLVFLSDSPRLDSFTGSDNDDTKQYYIYDDAERSLLCASCPPDGDAPRGSAFRIPSSDVLGVGPNKTLLSDGGDLAFATPTPLAAADQNTASAGEDVRRGTDVYEWRDGRPLLVSDGLTDWPSEVKPFVAAISPSGRDLFFIEAAQLTPDALDGYPRLYDARVGGGIEFPTPAKPCPLEVCQGTPKGAPEEATPGTSSFSGPGNPSKSTRCARAKRRVKGRCVAKKKHQRRANHQRRRDDKRRAAR